MHPNKITIGTRGSKLALYQAYKVKSEIENIDRNIQIEVKIIKTKGDKILDVALSKIGDKGLFTKELEVALINKEIDFAVHSLKDLPTELPSEFCVGAVLERADFRDALVSKNGLKLNELTPDHTIATSSLRRIAGLKRINPDFKIVDIRGNINTRLQKMEDGYCDAMIMAAAGLKRLELDHYITEILEPAEFIPAVAQGAIAIESLSDNESVNNFLKKINHQNTLNQVTAERSFMKTLMGGCQVPVGSYSKLEGETLTLTGFVSSLDGKQYLKQTISNSVNMADQMGQELAQKLIDQGANDILNSIRNA
ncbi:hydroxymethylbilane synthase [Plebeiibacterium sediminum]|uniref:Porphobilinogen deaminase n=1 Tax=Plebeiibacterium sediminum TaxID=2992112 RepID=A0AAE3M212_9BACT|nr:hydroxymethylbilane synthase [Plebeiobacterium sediminum]MCW3785360.1 hydroxymethylbilane synthase [Plebeiobacterium sediminum]